MGASSSIHSNKIYKHIECGCIYCFDYIEIQLLYCCYDCLELLRSSKNPTKIKTLICEVKNNTVDILLQFFRWINEKDAIIYAKENNILLEEFIHNKNLLKEFYLEDRAE